MDPRNLLPLAEHLIAVLALAEDDATIAGQQHVNAVASEMLRALAQVENNVTLLPSFREKAAELRVAMRAIQYKSFEEINFQKTQSQS